MGMLTGVMTINVDTTLENTIMMGNATTGPRNVMRNYCIDAAMKNHAVLVFRSTGAFSLCPGDIAKSDMFSMSTRYGEASQKLDVFAGLSDEEKVCKIMEICQLYTNNDSMKRPMYEHYLRLMLSLLRLKGVSVKLNELSDYDIDDIRALNNNPRYVPNPAIRTRNNNLLNSVTRDIADLQGIFSALAFGQVGSLLSGSVPLEKALDDYPVVEITLDFANKPEESLILMDAVIDHISALNRSGMRKKQLYVVADQIPIDIMKKARMERLLALTGYCHMLYMVTDISTLVDKDSQWVDHCTSYMSFHQNSVENIEYCSRLFGTEKRMKMSFFTNGKLGINFSWEEEPKYKPNVFSSLPENVCIFKSKKTGQDCRLTLS